jgi:hypothetical protein
MLNYEKYTSEAGEKFIIATDDKGLREYIPTDPANSDYQAYLNKDNPKEVPNV